MPQAGPFVLDPKAEAQLIAELNVLLNNPDFVDKFIEHTGIPFGIKKLVTFVPEYVAEVFLGLAGGIKKAPALFIGEQIFVDVGGAGEEDAIKDALLASLKAGIEATAQTIAAFVLLLGVYYDRGQTVASKLVFRDP